MAEQVELKDPKTKDKANVRGSGEAVAGLKGAVALIASDGTNFGFLQLDGSGNLKVVSAAGTALLGLVSSGLRTDKIMEGSVELTPKFVLIDENTTGDNTLVAAVPAKKIRVLNFVIIAGGTVIADFQSGAAGTSISGPLPITTNSGAAPGFCPIGHFETGVNVLLNLNLNGNVQVSGYLVYVEVD